MNIKKIYLRFPITLLILIIILIYIPLSLLSTEINNQNFKLLERIYDYDKILLKNLQVTNDYYILTFKFSNREYWKIKVSFNINVTSEGDSKDYECIRTYRIGANTKINKDVFLNFDKAPFLLLPPNNNRESANYSFFYADVKFPRSATSTNLSGWVTYDEYGKSKKDYFNLTFKFTDYDNILKSSLRKKSAYIEISGIVFSRVNANVRNGAGTNYSKIGQLKVGEKLTLKAENNKWYRFTSSRFPDGWIAKSLTTKTLPKSIDNKNPIVNLYQPELSKDLFRTEDFSSIIKGKATDNEGIFQVYINSETASLKSNGQFQKRIKLRIGKNPIEIRAIDINNNETTKEFLIIRDEIIEEDEFSDIDFALETSNNKPNAIAVVLGIEEYQYAPNVTNAYNDAEIMREYLISTFGLKRENIYFRYNERATKGEFEKVFSENGWISKNADKNSEIYVFYAGHGVASTDDKSAYLIPNDIDPNYASTGYSLNELYQNLSNIKSKSTTIILDACFSGISRDNEMLLADSRPISIEVKQGSIPKNLNVFSASSGSEISSGYSQKMHGLFTYFFLKGLNKNADINDDKKITYGEMEEYLKENVSSQARKMGREQNPQLHTSDKDKVLLKY